MADLKASAILQYGDAIYGRLTLPKKTAADDLQIGDFLKWDSTGVVKMAAATDDITFIGVCGTLSEDANGPQDILVYTQCICEVPTTSATFQPGAGLKFKTDSTLEDDAGANTIANSLEYKASATSLKVLVDVVSLQKRFEVND
jgi:predicted RecA/RadA family phage recombinase